METKCTRYGAQRVRGAAAQRSLRSNVGGGGRGAPLRSMRRGHARRGRQGSRILADLSRSTAFCTSSLCIDMQYARSKAHRNAYNSGVTDEKDVVPVSFRPVEFNPEPESDGGSPSPTKRGADGSSGEKVQAANDVDLPQPEDSNKPKEPSAPKDPKVPKPPVPPPDDPSKSANSEPDDVLETAPVLVKGARL
eukprot:3294016-Pleurochrysis_carterae.AAC.3